MLSSPSTAVPPPVRETADAESKEVVVDNAGAKGQQTSMEEKAEHKEQLFREIACYATFVLAGWSDATSGPLIPYMQDYFHINHTVVSTLFIGQMVGFITAGFLIGYLNEKFGLGKVITVGAAIQGLGYVFIIPAWPFPVIPVSYAIVGFGMALQDAAANAYIAVLPNGEHKFGYLHAAFGLGALICPLCATAFVSHGVLFARFYAISLGLAIIATLILLWGFKFSYRIPEIEREDAAGGDLKKMEMEGTLAADVGATGARVDADDQGRVQSLLKETLTDKTTWLFSLFILVYVGAEITQGGWSVTYIIEQRYGGPSSGYISTGFWAGIAIGRAILPRLNIWVGERQVVFYYLIVGAGLEFALWFGKNLYGNGVTIALIGFVFAPLYPICMSLSTQILPRHLHTSALGWIAAFGQCGTAIFPFATGALSQRFSIKVLPIVELVLFAVMGFVWIFIPRVKRNSIDVV
ncbi:MFS general substrate transporter [Meredithblackwellia eburnea MCA 4105]